jgi:hypothetical protein
VKFYPQEAFQFNYTSINTTHLVLNLKPPDDFKQDPDHPLLLFLKFKSRYVFVSAAGREPLVKEDLVIGGLNLSKKEVFVPKIKSNSKPSMAKEGVKAVGAVMKVILVILAGSGFMLNMVFGLSASKVWAMFNGI